MLFALQILPILIYILVIYIISKRFRKTISIYKKVINDATKELNNNAKKLVNLTQKNYLLKKKCDFLEKQLYPKNDKVTFNLDDILNEINVYGYDNLSKEKKDFLKNYNNEENKNDK